MYLINRIESYELLDFLFNPMLQAAYYKNYLLQKYKENESIDHVLYMNLSNGKFGQIAYVNYDLKKLFTERTLPFGLGTIDELMIVDIRKLKEDLPDKLLEIIKETKEEMLEKIKETHDYKRIHSHYMRKLYRYIIFAKLSAANHDFTTISFTGFNCNKFIKDLSISDITRIYEGSFFPLKSFAKETVFSHEYIESEVIVDEVTKEAEAYVKAGIYTQRELRLIDYLDQMKDVKAEKLMIIKSLGGEIACKNHISCEGYLSTYDMSFLKVDFEEIDFIKVDGAIVYQKEDLKKLMKKVEPIVEKIKRSI